MFEVKGTMYKAKGIGFLPFALCLGTLNLAPFNL
jgi:hypothetical protein